MAIVFMCVAVVLPGCKDDEEPGGGGNGTEVVEWVSYTKENSGLINNRVHCITIDAQENKWIGTYTNAVGDDGGLLGNGANCIAFDAQRNKWVGLYGGEGWGAGLQLLKTR